MFSLICAWFRRRSEKTSKLSITGLCAWNSPMTGELIRRRSEKTSKLSVTGLWGWNSPVTGEFPSQRPVTRSLSKQSWGWWSETPSYPVWRHCNVSDMFQWLIKILIPQSGLITFPVILLILVTEYDTHKNFKTVLLNLSGTGERCGKLYRYIKYTQFFCVET